MRDDASIRRPLLAWALVRNGEWVVDADGVVPVYETRRRAQAEAASGETPVRVQIALPKKKSTPAAVASALGMAGEEKNDG